MSTRTIFLVSCVGQKSPEPTEARDLYRSTWFKKARAWIEARDCDWFILSAEYGLLHPQTVIEPYDKSLNTMPVAGRRDWAGRVSRQLRAQLIADEIIVLAGVRYREFLMPVLREIADSVEVPMAGLGIGQQLAYLSARDSPSLL